MRHAFLLPLAACAFAFVLSSCDDDPATGQSSCDNPGVLCETIVVPERQVESDTEYLSSLDATITAGLYQIQNTRVEGYGPGKHVIVTVEFLPPLVVTSTLPFHAMLVLRPHLNDCFNWGEAPLAVTVTPTGRWPEPKYVFADAWGTCESGQPNFQVQLDYGDQYKPDGRPFKKGDRLIALTMEFTVPEKYDAGEGAGSAILPGDVELWAFDWQAFAAGDSHGSPSLEQRIMP